MLLALWCILVLRTEWSLNDLGDREAKSCLKLLHRAYVDTTKMKETVFQKSWRPNSKKQQINVKFVFIYIVRVESHDKRMRPLASTAPKQQRETLTYTCTLPWKSEQNWNDHRMTAETRKMMWAFSKHSSRVESFLTCEASQYDRAIQQCVLSPHAANIPSAQNRNSSLHLWTVMSSYWQSAYFSTWTWRDETCWYQAVRSMRFNKTTVHKDRVCVQDGGLNWTQCSGQGRFLIRWDQLVDDSWARIWMGTNTTKWFAKAARRGAK